MNAGAKEPRALARGRTLGEPFGGPFCWAGTPAFEKGTRRKGETASRRYRRNGYVPSKQQLGRLSGRLRQQG